MLQNYIKIALRNFNRFKGYTSINILGLALGLTCGILIMLFVLDELSYDRFHVNHDRIYRVKSGQNETNGWPVGEMLRKYPEVEALIYARNGSFLQVMHKNKLYTEDIHFAGEDFFKIFSFPVISGDSKTALSKPYQIVLSEQAAEKYFGSTDVLGESLILGDSLNFTVSGVVKVPRQSHIQFSMLASFETYPLLNKSFSYTEGWGNINVRNYLLLKKDADPAAFEAKITNLYMSNVGDFLKNMGIELYVDLEPLSDIYLNSDSGNGWGPQGSLDQLYLVSAIALFVILLACINFINLTTARSVYRAKEVGLRKVVGSSRRSLLWQFLSESFVLIILAFIVSLLLINLSIPLFNLLIGRNYTFSYLFVPEMVLGAIFLIILMTIISGYYPARVLSGYKPSETLKGKFVSGNKGVALRKSLVVFQFFISSVLVAGTVLALDQLQYMRDRDPGFDREQVLVLDASRLDADSLQLQTFKNEMKKLSSVQTVSFTNALPGKYGWQGQWCTPEGFPANESISVEYIAVDADYMETLGLELLTGRNYKLNSPADLKEGLLINETAVAEMGFGDPENALGKKITSPSGYPAGTVIGVVKDYHQEGMQNKIRPLVMDFEPRFAYYYALRFITGNSSELLKDLETTWSGIFPDKEFNYFFLDDAYHQQYQAEERLVNVLLVFAVITILIAVTGLFGLVSFIVVSRTKEIGIRKILGAGILDVSGHLSWEFIRLVLLSNAIFIPLVWYYGNQWLENFAYHVELKPAVFIITIILSIGIAILAVGYNTFKAALQNPVESIRSDA